MRCLTTANLIALTATIGLAVPAQAGSISGTITGDATLTPTGTPGVYVQNFSGEGDDTYFGSFTPTSSSMIDVSNPPKIVSLRRDVPGNVHPGHLVRHRLWQRHRQRQWNRDGYDRPRFHGWNRPVPRCHGGGNAHWHIDQDGRDIGFLQRILRRHAFDPRARQPGPAQSRRSARSCYRGSETQPRTTKSSLIAAASGIADRRASESLLTSPASPTLP